MKISDIEVAEKLLKIRDSAKSRNIDFDLSFKKVKQLLKTKKCFFSNVEMNNIHLDPNQLTFDRIDNSKGYIDSNVVACCKRMNSIKGSLSVEDIKFLYQGIIKSNL